MQAERSQILELLERQSRWQKSRKDLTWEEKVRMIEQVRAEVARWLPAYRKNHGADDKPAKAQE